MTLKTWSLTPKFFHVWPFITVCAEWVRVLPPFNNSVQFSGHEFSVHMESPCLLSHRKTFRKKKLWHHLKVNLNSLSRLQPCNTYIFSSATYVDVNFFTCLSCCEHRVVCTNQAWKTSFCSLSESVWLFISRGIHLAVVVFLLSFPLSMFPYCDCYYWHLAHFTGIYRVLPYYSNDIFVLLHRSFLIVPWRQIAIKSDWSTVGGPIKKIGGFKLLISLCLSK